MENFQKLTNKIDHLPNPMVIGWNCGCKRAGLRKVVEVRCQGNRNAYNN
jgi:hypothetical protein